MRFVARSQLPVAADRAWAWHMRPGAFDRLVPPWESVRMRESEQPLYEGCLRHLQVSPLRIPWRARHDRFQTGRLFRDWQESGPFARWQHHHHFEGNELRDEVEFSLPGGPLGRLLLPLVRWQMERMFCYRHLTTARDLSWGHGLPVRVAISGSHGVIGGSLRSFLMAAGCQVQRLVRGVPQQSDEVNVELDPSPLEGCEAVVHLAGRPLAQGNWGPDHRADAWSSRVGGTQRLVAALRRLQQPPRTFLCASGVGYYGPGARLAEEDAPAGGDFLARLCLAWEEQARKAEELGCRVVTLRLGPVLTLRGGMLPFLLPGAIPGGGEQIISWISLPDCLGLLAETLRGGSGAWNLVTPDSQRLEQLVRTLGRLMHRPSVRLGRCWTRRLVGRRADLILDGVGAWPGVPLAAGYGFALPELEGALRDALGCPLPSGQPDGWRFDWNV